MRIIVAIFGLVAICGDGVLAQNANPDRVFLGSGASLTLVPAAASRGGLFYVAQPYGSDLVVLDENGNEQRRIGREGDGPGEFRRPYMLGWVGDTMWVADPARQIVSQFMGGRFLQSFAAPGNGPLEVLPDGGVVYVERAAPDSARLLMSSGAHSPARELLTFSLEHSQLTIDLGSVVRQAAQPFDPSPSFTAEGGEVWLHANRVPRNVSDSLMEIEVYGADGTPARTVRIVAHPEPLTAVDRDIVVHLWIENLGEGAARLGLDLGSSERVLDLVAEALFLPELLPQSAAMYSGCGRVLVERFLSGGRSEWITISGGGQMKRTIVPRAWTAVGLGCEGALATDRGPLNETRLFLVPIH